MVLNQVIRETGRGGLPKIVLQHKAGASAEVYLWGATLASYKVENTRELLFVSKNALFDGKKGASWIRLHASLKRATQPSDATRGLHLLVGSSQVNTPQHPGPTTTPHTSTTYPPTPTSPPRTTPQQSAAACHSCFPNSVSPTSPWRSTGSPGLRSGT